MLISYYVKRNIVIGLALTFIGLCPHFATAQDNKEEESKSDIQQNDRQQIKKNLKWGLSDIGLDLTQNKSSEASDTGIQFSGQLINNNSRLINSLDVHARVFVSPIKKNSDRPENILVDKFTVATNITLPANTSKNISGEWEQEQSEKRGKYQIRFYVTRKHRFVVEGYPSSGKEAMETISFTIKSQNKGNVYIDRKNTKVNGKSHSFTKTSRYSGEDEVRITFPIINASQKKQKVRLDYNLYGFSQLREENKLLFQTENITLNPKQRKELLYTIPSPRKSIYVADIQAMIEGQRIGMNEVRFEIEDNDMPHITNTGISSFPVTKQDRLFVNITNTGSDRGPFNLETTLENVQTGETLAQIKQENVVSREEIQSFTSPIQTNSPARNVRLVTKLSAFDKTVDTFSIRYSCKEIQVVSCKNSPKILWYIGIGGLIVLVIGGVGIGVWMLRKNTKRSQI